MLVYEIALQIQYWGSIILFSIGVPGALMNMILFIGVKTFRQSPSAYYVIGQSLADVSALFLVLSLLIPSIPTMTSSITCKLMVFLSQVTVYVAMSFLCLSAFDRWACTSQSVRIRQLSSTNIARYLFLLPFILGSLMNIPFLIYCNIVPPMLICSFTNDIFMRIGTIFLSPILNVFLPLIILIIFGLMTYGNIRLVMNVRQQPNQIRRYTWEQQMTRMMLIQTLLSVFCTIPRAIFVIYTIATFNQRAMRSFDQISIELVVDQLTLLILCINFASSFYLFFLSSPRFRQTIQIYLKRLFNLKHNQIGPPNISLTAPAFTVNRTANITVQPTISIEHYGK